MSSATAPHRVSAAPSLAVTLENTPEAAAVARDVAGDFLKGLGPPPDRDASDAVVLIVSELVTNAVRHTLTRTCTLSLAAAPGTVTVAVSDASPRPPCERNPDVRGEGGGFGWPMVRRLAVSTSVETSAQGKTVTAVVAREGRRSA
ncbi:ATP-binding protein [Streptomyces chrestomyceticus JCM 4735]|uniref:ATP-binding protein n=1 Tax=Streptomyces chrestomyceticus JCM 4735 TaxID=1306181 RepID=A0A7U9L2T8_9ACTN|nr:ATP-binding protein [Streptomyces chrestomyceticus]GCD40024.1 ATP-binding protein [Streptomyces chrestomyceticus JCM 4735]